MKTDRKQTEKIAYGSFYLGVIIEVLMVIIDKSALINPVEGRLFQLTFLLFLIKTCLTRYDKKEYAVIAAFLALGAISYFVTGRNDIVRIVMFLAACKNVDMQKCLKLVFYMTLTGCLLIMLLSFFGDVYKRQVLKNEARGNPSGYRRNILKLCRSEEIRDLVKRTEITVNQPANKLLYLVMKHPGEVTVRLLRLAMIWYYRS